MKVFIVVGEKYSGELTENLGVFDSKKKAEKFTKKHQEDKNNIRCEYEYSLQEWEIK